MAIERVLVRFDRQSTPYASGEIAGFARDRAALYVKNNIAHYCNAKGESSSSPVTVKVDPPSVVAARAEKPAA